MAARRRQPTSATSASTSSASDQLRRFSVALYSAVAVEAALLTMPLLQLPTLDRSGGNSGVFGVHGLNHAVSPSGFNLRHLEFALPPPPQWCLLWLGASVGMASAAAAVRTVYADRASVSGGVGWWHGVGLLCGWTWLWTSDSVLYNNHYYLYSVLLALLLLSRRGGDTPETTAAVIRAQIAIVYVWAAIAKLDPDWMDGSIALAILQHPRRRWVLRLVGQRLACATVAWGGIAVLLIAPVAMVADSRGVRTTGQSMIAAFHLGNLTLFGVSGIGCFSLVMIASITLYPRGIIGIRGRGATPRRLGAAAAPIALLVCQAALPLAQFSQGPTHPPGWGKRVDRWAWRMKSTVERLGVRVPGGVGAGVGESVVPLCQVTLNGVAINMTQLNPAQREEVCLRPAAAEQAAKILALGGEPHAGGGHPSLCLNTWLSLNRHPFQPRHNVTISHSRSNSGGDDCTPSLAVLPWTRNFGPRSEQWAPVWVNTRKKYAEGNFRVEFLVLPATVPGKFPWWQGTAMPSFCEALSGNLTIMLRRRVGDSPIPFAVAAGGAVSVAEFPRGIHEWWIAPNPHAPPAFFVLAWPGTLGDSAALS